MNGKTPNARPGRDGPAPEAARTSIIFPFILLALLLIGGAGIYFALEKSPPPPSAPAPAAVVPPLPQAMAAAPTHVPPVKPPGPSATPAQPAIPPAPPDHRSPKELMASLTQIDGQNPLTADQAQAWKQALQQLVRHGPAAVPAIQEFLAQSQGSNYSGLNGLAQLGYPSLRAGLIDALAQIGGTEATAAMLQILQSSAVPSDVADLAKALGPSATGEYQQEFLAAIRLQLFAAQQPQASRDTDVAPLFQVLAAQAANGAQVAQDIQQYGAAWSFYSAITLANLPGGTGLPALAQMAQTPGAGQTVALDSLAQMALANPQALAALLDLAKNGAAQDDALSTVAPFLAGRQYLLPSAAGQIPPGASVQSIHMNSGNQNFLSYQVSSPALLPRQMAALDQLLQVIPPADADALQALQQQKSALSSATAK
ncbi:MAG TPA: hypothetical protein VN765_05250 [Candidatus Acidoferrum sp.]|nr:hypothetical protein [Candidatus Acidoferrum sp.]